MKTKLLILFAILFLPLSGRAADNSVAGTKYTPGNGYQVPWATVDDGSGNQILKTTSVSSSGATAATTVKSTALEASRVLKASAGSLGSITVYNSNASAQFILVMDSATVPANGAVVLLLPPIPIPGNTILQIPFHFPLVAANGISVCNSSTGTFTKTLGAADCVFTGQVF